MNSLIPYIIIGLAPGAVYGLAASGLVLTYKTSGIFNFGYGALATIAAYVFYWLRIGHGLNWEISFVLSVAVLGPLMGLLMEPFARYLSAQPLIYKVTGTVGLLVSVQGLATIKYGTEALPVPSYLPLSQKTFDLFGTPFGYEQLFILAIALVVVVGLGGVFRYARIGLLMRAVVNDAELLDLEGTSPVYVRRVASVIGCTIAALSGVLILPLVGLDPLVLTLLVVQAFGAAAVGAFSNIPLTFVGGLGIGILSSISLKFVAEHSWISGLPEGLPFFLLIVVLLALPRRLLLPPVSLERQPQSNFKANLRTRLATAVLVVALLATIPLFAGSKLVFFCMGISLMVVLLSLGLLIRTAGQVSLCHAAFMAIGACAFSDFVVNDHMSWLVGFLLAGAVTVPIGALVAIPAIRLSGLFLSLVTLGFGILVAQFFYPLNFMFGAFAAGRSVPRPSFASSDTGYFYFILAVVILTAALLTFVHEGRLGRFFRGLAESPTALAGFGLNVNATTVLVFCISTFFASLGGVLYAGSFTFAASGDFRFQWLFSLVLVVLLVISPFREPWYALPSAVGVALPAFWNSGNSLYWLNAITGVFAIMTALAGGPPVMPDRLRARFQRVAARPASMSYVIPGASSTDAPGGKSAARPTHSMPRADAYPRGIVVRDLTVRYGGITAVDALTLAAPRGTATGLIGPNGAGKTTMFNAISGTVRPSDGRITYIDKDVSHMAPSRRARLGLGRTFQRMNLCAGLSTFDNVALGYEAGKPRGVLAQFVASPSAKAAMIEATLQALELCNIREFAAVPVGELSTGHQRLVEVARCLAGRFEMLLLDEPSSGLDHGERMHLADLISRLVADHGLGVLLVEHDVDFVTSVCSRVFVLDFGRLLFEGSPDEVLASSVVREAYLGRLAPEEAGDVAIHEGGSA